MHRSVWLLEPSMDDFKDVLVASSVFLDSTLFQVSLLLPDLWSVSSRKARSELSSQGSEVLCMTFRAC